MLEKRVKRNVVITLRVMKGRSPQKPQPSPWRMIFSDARVNMILDMPHGY